MNRSQKTIAALLVLLAIVVVMTMASRARQRNALETYRAELVAKGEKLTFADLDLSDDPDPENIFGQFTNAVQRLVTPRLEPGMIAYPNTPNAPRSRPLWVEDALPLVNSTPGKPAGSLAWAAVAEQAELNRDALEEMRRLLESPPRSVTTSRSDIFRNTGNFVAKRRAAQHLAADAIAALHAGDSDRARENLRALTQLVQLHRDEPTLVNAMVRVAVAGLALNVTQQALAHPDWKDGELRVLAAAWEDIDFLEITEAGMCGERTWIAEFCQDVRTKGDDSSIRDLIGRSSGSNRRDWKELPMALLFRLTLDENELLILRHWQAGLESMRKLSDGVPWPEVQAESSTNAAQMQALSSGPMRWRYAFAATAPPTYLRAQQVTVQRETERRLCLTAIALRRFQLRHERLPESLDELTPDFLTAVTLDPISGQPLRFQCRDDGDYLLYSVGEDGVDDGGDAVADSVWPAWAGGLSLSPPR